MIFVTRQHPQVLETLLTTGTYTVQEEFIHEKYTTITDHYAPLYRMLTSMARGRVVIPDGAYYPIWLSPEGINPIPPSEDSVFLRFDIPEEHFILANDEVWDYMVNHVYYPADKSDEAAHEAELARYGISSPSSLIGGSTGNFYPLLKQKVIRSWQSIFTTQPANPSNIVGLCWELKKEWLI